MEEIQGYKFGIDLDDGGMTRSLKELRNEAKLLKTAMKSNFTEIKSGGDAMKAYASKVVDAKRAISGQEAVIKKLREQQKGLDMDTEKGRSAYVRYENQIKRAKTEISNLSAQQERAKKSADLFKSGVLDVQRSVKLATSANKAYVERLQAEGRTSDAVSAKHKGLRDSYEGINKQLAIEKQHLNEAAEASGKSSDAYREQSIRVNELGTKLAHTKDELADVRRQDNALHPTGINRLIAATDRANHKTEKADHLFGKIFGAHLLASGVINAWQSLTNHISEAVKAGADYEKEQQKMQATWLTLTGTAKKSDSMVKTINELSVKTGQAVDVVNELEQGFYHLHSSKKESDELTKSMLNMSDAVGLNSQQIQAVTQDMVNGLSRGKANAGMLNQISQYFPMFREQLAKYETQVHHGKKVTVADLAAMAKSGQISANDIEKTFNQLGSGKYDKAADNMLKTMVGMERTIKARVPTLLGDMEKPIMTAKNPLYAAVAKWVSDPRTDKEFTKVGRSASQGINTITKAFAQAFGIKSAPQAMNRAMNSLAKGVTDASKSIARNAPEIKNLLVTLKSLGGIGFKTLIDSLKIANFLLKPFVKLIGGNADTFAKFAATWFVASKGLKAFNKGLRTVQGFKDIFGKAAEIFGLKKEKAAIDEETAALNRNSRARQENADTSIGGSAGSGKVSEAETVAEDITGDGVGKEAKELKTVEKAGEEAKGLRKLHGLGELKNVSKYGKFLAGGVGAFDVINAGFDLVGTTKKTVGSHVGAAGGSLGGTALGAAIGTAIAPGIGTAIGAGLGGSVGEGIGKKLGRSVQKGFETEAKTKHKASNTKPDQKTLSTDPYGAGAGGDIGGLSTGDTKATRDAAKKRKSVYDGLTRETTSFLKDTHTQLTKANSEYLTILGSGSKSAIAKNKETYGKILSSVESYTAARRKTEDKNINYLRSTGAITVAQQKQQLKDVKDGSTQQVSAVKRTIDAIKKDEKSGGGQRQALVAKLNGQLLRLTDASAKKQRKIYKELSEGETKLSSKQYSEVMKKSKEARKQTVSDAEKQYESQKKNAQKTYDKTLKSAAATYGVHSKMYQKIKGYAQKQYDKTTDAAYNQYKETVKWANKQAKAVVTAAANAAGGINGIMGVMSNNLNDMLNQTESATGGKHKKPITDDQSIKNNYNVDNKLAKAAVKSANKKVAKNKIHLQTGVATGGAIRKSMLAMVGENGFEVLQRGKKFATIGANGAQLVDLKSGDRIYNHREAQKMLKGVYGNRLPGFAEGNAKLLSFAGGTSHVSLDDTKRLKHSAFLEEGVLKQLADKKGKLSKKQLNQAVAASKKEFEVTSKFADKRYKTEVGIANKKYKGTMAAAKAEYKGNSSYAKKQRTEIEKHARKQRDNAVSDAEHQRKDTVKKAKGQYNDTVNYAKEQNKGVTKQSDNQYSNLKGNNSKSKDNYATTWHGIWRTVGNWTNKMLSGLNKGAIKGQNQVFKQYGGTDTLSSISASYFASGTGLLGNIRRAITKPTLAVLNDGHDSPETGNQEAVLHPDGGAELIHGRNTMKVLEPGAEVLNASETKLMSQLGLMHFASGTGFLSGLFKSVGKVGSFFKNAFGSLKDKLKAITGFTSNATKSFNSTFNPDFSGLKGGVAKGYAHIANHKIRNQGQKWWSAAWNVINGAANASGGDATGLLAAVEKYGKGHRYVWGAAGPDSFDCSGLVMYALKHAFGINYPHFSGSQYGETQHISKSSAKPGDLVFWGPNSHVGVYAGGSKYYSAFNPSAHPNIGMYNMYTHGGDGRMLFGRVKGLSGKTDTKKNHKQAKGLSGFVTKQLKSSGVLSWVKKFLEPLTDSIGGAGNPSGDGVGRWRSDVKKALTALHLSTSSSMVNRVLRQISTESHGDPNIIGGTDGLNDGRAMGLMQVKPGTFKAYGKASLGKWNNGLASIYAGLNYAKHRYGSSLSYLGNGHGYSNGGLSQKEKLAHISEGNMPEMVIPLSKLKSSRGYELLGKTAAIMAKRDHLEVQSNNSANNTDKLMDKLDQVIGLMQSLLVGQQNPTPAVVSANDIYSGYNQVKTKKSLSKNLGRGYVNGIQ